MPANRKVANECAGGRAPLALLRRRGKRYIESDGRASIWPSKQEADERSGCARVRIDEALPEFQLDLEEEGPERRAGRCGSHGWAGHGSNDFWWEAVEFSFCDV